MDKGREAYPREDLMTTALSGIVAGYVAAVNASEENCRAANARAIGAGSSASRGDVTHRIRAGPVEPRPAARVRS
jgi:hypothetical protein